jgi:acetamidase/formamidase
VRSWPGWSVAAAITAMFPLSQGSAEPPSPAPEYRLGTERTHHKFSAAIPPVLHVPSGAIIEAFTHEATGGQLALGSTDEDLAAVDWDVTHALTGPIYVEGARPGDVLAVTLLEVEAGTWGWIGIWPGEGILPDEAQTPSIRTFSIENQNARIRFSERITLPLRPFPGVLGVAPATDEMLSTTPPRANGGNMDDPNITAGTTVYFPVFVDGALFSIGDTHALQGAGEVGGSALEAPMRIRFRLEVLRGHRPLQEPQYETHEYYATTGFATTLDEAAQKATRYMIDYLATEHELSRAEAYMLCSLVCDLRLQQAVNAPHRSVAMHLPKDIFAASPSVPTHSTRDEGGNTGLAK